MQSVFADWNGGGASGAFLACLTILSQDDVEIARVFPDQQFAAGDTGEVTYAPFLRAAAAAAAGADLQWAVSVGSLTSPTGPSNSVDSVQTLVRTNESSYFSLANDELRVLKTGLYLVFALNRGQSSSIAETQVYDNTLNYNTASSDASEFNVPLHTPIQGWRTNAAGTSRIWNLVSGGLHNIKSGAINGGFYTNVTAMQAAGATMTMSSSIWAVRLSDALAAGLP